MASWKHIQGLMIVAACLFMTAAQVLLCAPAEEQQPHTITFSKVGNAIIWSKDNSAIVTCYFGQCIPEPHVTGYNASVSGNTSSLFIFNVTRENEGTYSCRSGPRNSSCDLRVYAKPTSVSCLQAVLQADSVTVVCSVTRIYPNPVCQFEWTTNRTVNQIAHKQISYENQVKTVDPTYFNSECRLNLPVRNFPKGSHRFRVTVYPNVTGRDIDVMYGSSSIWTYPQSVSYPTVVLESCPDTYVSDGKPFSCTCRETANVFLLANTTLVYGPTRVTNSAVTNVTATFTANRAIEELDCQAELQDGTFAVIKHKLCVAFGPTITSFEVNNSSMQTIVDINSDVSFSCQAEGKPSPRLSLRKDGREIAHHRKQFETSNVSLTFSGHVKACTDAGVYECLAQTDQTVANKSLEVNVKCAYQLENKESQNMVYRARVNSPYSVTVRVFGYPEPDLQLEGSTYTLDVGTYALTHVRGIPPYSVILIKMHEVEYQTFQQYNLRITNVEGILVYRFTIADEAQGAQAAQSPSEVSVGGLAGGIVALVLAIVTAVTAIVVLHRKGLLMKRWIKRNGENMPSQPRQSLRGSSRQTDLPHSAVSVLASDPHYEEISDISSSTNSYYAYQPFPASPDETNQYVVLVDYVENGGVPSNKENVGITNHAENVGVINHVVENVGVTYQNLNVISDT